MGALVGTMTTAACRGGGQRFHRGAVHHVVADLLVAVQVDLDEGPAGVPAHSTPGWAPKGVLRDWPAAGC